MEELYKSYNIEAVIGTFQNLLNQYPDLRNESNIAESMDTIVRFLNDFSYLRHAIDASVIVAATTLSGKIIFANDKFCEISKYHREELLGQNHRLLNSGHHDKEFFENMWDTISSGEIWEGEVKNKAKDGSTYWVKTTIVPLNDASGKPILYMALRTDITKGKVAQEKLIEALKNDFSTVVNSINNLIFKLTITEDHRYMYILHEGKLAKQIGLPHETMVHKSPREVFDSDLADMLEMKYAEAFHGTDVSYTYSYNNRRLFTTLSPVYSNGEVTELIGCINDITDLHDAQEKVRFMAYHDHITNLPNRRKLKEDIDELIKTSTKDHSQFAVFFLDLDRLKQINDSLGHAAGDELIREVSTRLNFIVGAKGTVYRLAGDEFTIVYPIVNSSEDIKRYAKQLLCIFENVFTPIEHMEIYSSCSIGISVSPEHGNDYDTLLKNADSAMYVAKSRGRNTFVLYEPVDEQDQDKSLLIEYHLRTAIENNEFELHFQPILDLKSMKMTRVETLLRWNSPILGNVPPTKFIPIAEETGLIIKIDEWVMGKTCLVMKKWNETIFLEPIKVSINVSPLHFRLPNFDFVVGRMIQKTRLDPELLEIEITENSLIDYTEDCISCLINLKGMGVSVAIDDFGKGYSSLNYLRRLPVSSLKIDQIFIQELATNHEDTAIVKAITVLAHELNLKVVAEGVETQEVISLISELGCDEIQGYYISKPLSKEAFEEWYTESYSTKYLPL
jgi:diguanylate cyclase (GGDEF)-like protein/PAS domain S-box-containing protein